jgi:hypothetical protein
MRSIVAFDRDNFSKKIIKEMVEHAQQLIEQGNIFVGNLCSDVEFTVSHTITRIEYDDATDCLMAEFEFLKTGKGPIAMKLYDDGMVDLSARAICTKDPNGEIDALFLVTCDLVYLDEAGQRRKKRELKLQRLAEC